MRKSAQPFAIVALLAALSPALAVRPAAADTPDVTIADFEGASYPPGWTTTGTAFGSGPAHGTLPNQMPVSGFEGSGLVNSYYGKDASVGTLTSPPFTLSHKYLTFLLGGGHHPGQEEIQLLIDGKIVRRATGPDSERLGWRQWDISDLNGKSAVMEIVDTATGGWGHISVDSIKLSDTTLPDERTTILASSMAIMRKEMPKADADPNRPVFHFHAPALRMNDPNGPIYYDGWYHMFYQLNPDGSLHWGHARSRDLVNWEHLPMALWPSRQDGERHVYSGSMLQRGDGTPMAFYTSIGDREPEQWASLPDDKELILWHKVASNPMVSAANRGGATFAEWRDPFLFREKGKAYLITGGGDNGQGIVTLYQAENEDLTAWKYLGIIFHHPDAPIKNVECPNIAKVDGKWVLITSTYGKGHQVVDAFVGQLDVDKVAFTYEKRSLLADGSYASQLVRDANGKLIHLAWMPTGSGSGWNGYVTLPSELGITSDGTLTRRPIRALDTLRDKHVQVSNQSVTGAFAVAGLGESTGLEIVTTIEPQTATAVTLNLRASADGTRAIKVRYVPATRTLYVDGRPPVEVPASSVRHGLQLHVFLDRGALDVYTEDGVVTEASYFGHVPASDFGVQVVADGGTAKIVHMAAYTVKAAVLDETRVR